jgi:hypothetical protein
MYVKFKVLKSDCYKRYIDNRSDPLCVMGAASRTRAKGHLPQAPPS